MTARCDAQDYSYLRHADSAYPGFFKGMLVADPAATDPVGAMRELVQSNPGFWVGVRFNPYKFTDEKMADEVGQQLFKAAGEMRLPVGFMPFKGLNRHADAIESLIAGSPSTQVYHAYG